MVITKNRRTRSEPSKCRTGGWLALSRRASEGIALEGAQGEESRTSITVLRTKPLTLQLSLPRLGVVDLAIEGDGAAVHMAFRADRSIHIVRTELE